MVFWSILILEVGGSSASRVVLNYYLSGELHYVDYVIKHLHSVFTSSVTNSSNDVKE